MMKTSGFGKRMVGMAVLAAMLFAPMGAVAGPRHHGGHGRQPQRYEPARHDYGRHNHPRPHQSSRKQYREDRKVAAATFGAVAAIGLLAVICSD